jgi:hypothetical protein
MDKRCTECGWIFEGYEITRAKADGPWGHPCRCSPHQPEMRCESYLADFPVDAQAPTSKVEQFGGRRG